MFPVLTGTLDLDCGLEMTPRVVSWGLSATEVTSQDRLSAPPGWGEARSCYVKTENGDGESGFSSEIILIKTHSQAFTQVDAQASGWNPKAGGCHA